MIKKPKIYNIALIGAGNIGSRHLQALAKSKLKLNLFIIDTNNKSLTLSKSRYELLNKKKRKILYSTKLNILPSVVDVAIIATNSNVKKKILIEIIRRNKIRFLILEKYSFQNIKDFYAMAKIFKKKRIKTWVNCPFRYMSSYERLRKKINCKIFHLDVRGGNWNMASTMIHYIDLFCYFTNSLKIKFIRDELGKKIIKSKRSSFYEIKGAVKVRATNGSTLEITDSYDNSPLKITFFYKNKKSIIFWKKNIIQNFNSLNKKNVIKRFKIEKQSNLTDKYVENIIKKGSINLPSFHESSKIQIQIINFLSKFFSKILKKNIKNCPIT